MEDNKEKVFSKRQKVKVKRNKGLLAMHNARIDDVIEWNRGKDPLYQVKGKERHYLSKLIIRGRK